MYRNSLIPFAVIALFFATAVITCSDENSREEDNNGKKNNKKDGGSDADTDTDTDLDTDGDSDGDDDGCSRMDILFMIDNSASMDCEQDLLADSFPEFISIIEEYADNQDTFEYRLGVTTTSTTAKIKDDMPDPIPDVPRFQEGDDGILREFFGEPDPWLDGPNPDRDIPALFSQTALVGVDGPPYEMPLQALELFLDKTEAGGENEGFLRENSVFALLLITDEDDCSHPKEDTEFAVPTDMCMQNPARHNLQELSYYKQMLDDRFGEDSYVIIVIAGKTACETSTAECSGDDPVHEGCRQAGARLLDFMENYIGITDEDNGVFADICTVDIPMALEVALRKMSIVCDEYVPME